MKTETFRIYHSWDKWECFKAGFYNSSPPDGLSSEDCEIAYRDFLMDLDKFARAMDRVFKEWPNSCEHFLTNPSINRIAWLGQAAMCITSKISSNFRAGFKLLTEDQQKAANELAERYLQSWSEEKCQSQKRSISI